MAIYHHFHPDLQAEGDIQSLWLEVRGKPTHFLKAGRGPAVVLLHGGASNSRDWMGTMAALSHSYELYAPDMVGYGLNGADNEGYYLADFVESTLGFVQMLNLGSYVLVGHSLGGRVCLEIALRHPQLVRKLVLVDTPGFSKLAPWGSFIAAAAWATRKVMRRVQPYPKFLKRDGEDNGWLCLEKLPDLKIPSLLVWYRHDPYCPLKGAIKAKELIPEARLEVIPGYGHAPHVKKTEIFNSLLQDFLG